MLWFNRNPTSAEWERMSQRVGEGWWLVRSESRWGGAVGLLMADVQKALMGMTKKQGLDLGAARE